jgi:hypothetical protein
MIYGTGTITITDITPGSRDAYVSRAPGVGFLLFLLYRQLFTSR